jgi:MoxR-like ATPase
VLPEDIKALAVPVLAHRLIISSQAWLRGRRADDVVEEVVRSVPVPIERE